MLGKIGWRRLVAVLGIVTMCTVNIGNDYTVRRQITIGHNSKLNFRLTSIRPRGLTGNCTFLSA